MASSSKVIVDMSEEEEEEEVYEVEKLMGHRHSIMNKVNNCPCYSLKGVWEG